MGASPSIGRTRAKAAPWCNMSGIAWYGKHPFWPLAHPSNGTGHLALHQRLRASSPRLAQRIHGLIGAAYKGFTAGSEDELWRWRSACGAASVCAQPKETTSSWRRARGRLRESSHTASCPIRKSTPHDSSREVFFAPEPTTLPGSADVSLLRCGQRRNCRVNPHCMREHRKPRTQRGVLIRHIVMSATAQKAR
jgi:hypothetical protein